MLSTLFVFSLLASPALADSIPIPNYSFEDPALPAAPPYASPAISDWQKLPVPSWWTQAGYTADAWNDSAGTFVNVNVPGEYIDNCDGNQAAFVFAVPGYELYQDLSATYHAGLAYQLTVAIEGGGYGMPAGFPMDIVLYYRDGNGNQVAVGTTTVTNTNPGNPITHLTDYSVSIPAVAASDPWAGQSIGVELLQIESGTGYWDVDNVRLTTTAVPEPGSLVLLAVGLGMLAARRWRASKQ